MLPWIRPSWSAQTWLCKTCQRVDALSCLIRIELQNFSTIVFELFWWISVTWHCYLGILMDMESGYNCNAKQTLIIQKYWLQSHDISNSVSLRFNFRVAHLKWSMTLGIHHFWTFTFYVLFIQSEEELQKIGFLGLILYTKKIV